MRPVPDGIRLQQAQPADFARAFELARSGLAAYRDWAPDWTLPATPPERMREMEETIAADRAWVLMALDTAGEVAGIASLALGTTTDPSPPPPGSVYLWQLFVAPAWQGSGLARALLDRVVAEARRRGFERMILWAAEGAVQARRFYEREGWVATGARDPEPNFGMPIVQYGLDIAR